MGQRNIGATCGLPRQRFLKRVFMPACLALLSLAACASRAPASVTLGQLAPGVPATCATNNDWAQPTVTSGNTYVVPGNGIITSWSHIASASAGERMSMKIWRQVSGLNYLAVGHDGPRTLEDHRCSRAIRGETRRRPWRAHRDGERRVHVQRCGFGLG